MAVPDNIILGDGVFSINGVDVALTRGGGNFKRETEFKLIEADGDYGPVKDRIRKTKAVATLKMNALELLQTNLPKLYAALSLNTSDSAKDVLTGSADVNSTDYNNTVSWTGKTKAGKNVYIELQNAINLENIDWKLVDKDEIVPEITFTATYLGTARTTEPWKVEFAKTASGDANPPVMTLMAPKAGASTSVVLSFNEYLASATLAITDRANLLSSLTNDGTTITITTSAGSVTWLDANTANPKAIVTIASTTFVSGKTVRANAKASAIADLSTNYIAAATNSDAVVTS